MQQEEGLSQKQKQQHQFDMCALEDVEKSKNDASKSTTSKFTKTPTTGLTPAIMLKQCEEIMANLVESVKQRHEAQAERIVKFRTT